MQQIVAAGAEWLPMGKSELALTLEWENHPDPGTECIPSPRASWNATQLHGCDPSLMTSNPTQINPGSATRLLPSHTEPSAITLRMHAAASVLCTKGRASSLLQMQPCSSRTPAQPHSPAHGSAASHSAPALLAAPVPAVRAAHRSHPAAPAGRTAARRWPPRTSALQRKRGVICRISEYLAHTLTRWPVTALEVLLPRYAVLSQVHYSKATECSQVVPSRTTPHPVCGEAKSWWHVSFAQGQLFPSLEHPLRAFVASFGAELLSPPLNPRRWGGCGVTAARGAFKAERSSVKLLRADRKCAHLECRCVLLLQHRARGALWDRARPIVLLAAKQWGSCVQGQR